MTRPLLITLAAALPAALSLATAEETPDLLRMQEGDQLRGRFEGISEGPKINWHRKDFKDTAQIGIGNLRHLVLRGGNPAQPLKSISLVELINGDQIPGTITALDDKSVTIESDCVGTLTIDRNKIARIAPQPLGGRLHYHGPFSEDRWEVTSYNPDNEEGGEQAQVRQLRQEIQIDGNFRGRMQIGPGRGQDQPADPADEGPGWKHSGAAWYWKSSNPGTALILRDTMPKQSTLRFDLAWKSQLNVAIAVHADFCVDELKEEKPEADEELEKQDEIIPQRAQFIPHDSSSLPSIFGNAFVLQIHSNYMVIYRTVVDEEGNKSVKRVQTSSNRLRIGENATHTFELRSDLETSNFSLFVNGEFVTQWSDPALKDKKMEPVGGSSLAFMPQIAGAQVKLSDIIIAEWNGMPDSARSLEVEEQDIILMTNGLDRLSGKAVSLEDNGMLRFKGKHGEFMLPLDDISELRMATKNRLKLDPPSGQQLKVRFSPMGCITGTPISGDRKNMVLNSPLAGDVTILNDAAVMFEFDDSNDIFTNWDANF